MRPGPYSAHASDDLIAHEKAPPRRGFFDKETQRDRLAPLGKTEHQQQDVLVRLDLLARRPLGLEHRRRRAVLMTAVHLHHVRRGFVPGGSRGCSHGESADQQQTSSDF